MLHCRCRSHSISHVPRFLIIIFMNTDSDQYIMVSTPELRWEGSCTHLLIKAKKISMLVSHNIASGGEVRMRWLNKLIHSVYMCVCRTTPLVVTHIRVLSCFILFDLKVIFLVTSLPSANSTSIATHDHLCCCCSAVVKQLNHTLV